MHNFHILIGSAKKTAKRWRAQYGACRQKLADGTDTADILRKLEALERPTKQAVDEIIGNNGWTDIRCVCCHEYKPKVASFGSDETSEVCEPCLRRALIELTQAKIEK